MVQLFGSIEIKNSGTMSTSWINTRLPLTFVLLVTFTAHLASSCTTPDNRQGSCIPVRECASLYNIIANKRPLTTEDRTYISQSQCGWENNGPLVCCPTETGSRVDTASPLLPRPGECGIGSTNRIYGGEETDIDEFPWNCLIEYSKPNNKQGFHCGCVLINQNYVLTASHCVNGKDIPTTWRLSSIRLGEWNISTSPDCSNGDCAPPHQDIAVAQLIPHEQYAPTSKNQFNDIALIRLSRPVTYNDFVRPICLPVDNHLRSKSHIQEALEVSGWGRTETLSASNVKLKVSVKGVSKESCNTVYARQSVTVGDSQICAGGERGKDSCRGDSGGPLVALDSQPGQIYNYLVGLVSYGPSPCGQQGWPGVYTRVSSYIDWINRNLQP